MNVFKYTYRKARFMNNCESDEINKIMPMSAFWVRIYFVFDGSVTYSFYNQADWIENAELARELNPHGISTFTYEILVSRVKHKEIYEEIKDFENVLKSNLNKEC